jgi:hypothetical protein
MPGIAAAQSTKLPFSTEEASYAGKSGEDVTRYVKAAVTDLESGDEAKIVQARVALVAPARVAAAAPAFNAFFAQQLSQTIGASYDKLSLPAKLNAAIIVTEAARKTRDPALAPVIAKITGENSSGLVTWGLRASAPILPRLLQGNAPVGPGADLLRNIVAAPTKFIESGEIAQDAYDALTTEVLKSGPDALPTAARNQAIPHLITAVQDVMNARLEAFKGNAGTPPPGPKAELQAFRFLRLTADLATPPQTAETLRGLAAMLNVVSPIIVAGGQPVQVDRDLRDVVKTIGAEAQIAGGKLKADDLTAAGRELSANGGPGTPAAVLGNFATKAAAQLEATANKLAPAPTTAPAKP